MYQEQGYELESDVAIVGMDCYFPGASGISQLWQVLSSGTETISHFTVDELIAAGVPAERASHPSYVPAKGVIHGVEFFDHEFFGVGKTQAEVMDPQQRLFLEFAWKALEGAGYDSAQYEGRIGIFAGQAFNTYLLNNLRHARESHIGQFHGIDLLVMTDKDFLTTLTAHHLGLTGPAVTVQTACSSSLVAVHQACQALLNRECELALAGAITVYSPQVKGYFYEPGNLISPDGHIRSFDVDGRGTVYSSGMGLVVLKLLTDAIREGDMIHAVIKGSAVNNDGGRKGVFKAPSEDGIAEVAATALAVSGVDVARIRMVEANGSGTENGDPIEVHGMSRAFREFTDRVGHVAIGSVKSNLGHLNVAAGIAAVLKAALCVKHGQIVPTVNFREPNPAIQFAGSPFAVARELADWPQEEGPRLASVNSYGVGGTNGHLVISQAPEAMASDPASGDQLLVLSAKTATALERMRRNLAEYLDSAAGERPALSDICYTLQVGRRQLPYRLAAVAADAPGLRAAVLDAPVVGPVLPSRSAPRWWFASDMATDDIRPVLDTDSPVWATLAGGVAAALSEAGQSRSIGQTLASPATDTERAMRTLISHLALAAFLGPVIGVGSAAGDGVGTLSAAVATGSLSVLEAVKQLVNTVGGGYEQATAVPCDLVVRGTSVGRPPEGNADWLSVVAQMWLSGTSVDWLALHDGKRRTRVPLPTYSFEKVRCWVDIPSEPTGHVYDAAL